MDYYKYLTKAFENVIAGTLLILAIIAALIGVIIGLVDLVALLPQPYRVWVFVTLMAAPLCIWFAVFRAWARRQHAKEVGARITR